MSVFHNIPLIAGAMGWFVAEIIKMIIKLARTKDLKNLSWRDLFSSGGMPSSHTGAVCGLASAMCLTEGAASPAFAVAVVLAAIVMYDASGVRRETGEQGKTLNMIIRDLFSSDPRYADSAFKELVGHTKMQVLMGAIVGIGVGIGVYFGMTYLFSVL